MPYALQQKATVTDDDDDIKVLTQFSSTVSMKEKSFQINQPWEV